MTPLAEARQYVAGVLSGVLDCPVYDGPVDNPEVPSVTVGAPANDPWIEPRQARNAVVHVGVRLVVGTSPGAGDAMARIEDLVWAIIGAVPPEGKIPAPRLAPQGNTEVYSVDIRTVIKISE